MGNKSKRMIGAGMMSIGNSIMDYYYDKERTTRSTNRDKAYDERQKRRFAREDIKSAAKAKQGATQRKADRAQWEEDRDERRRYTEGQAAKKPTKTPSPWEVWYEQTGKPKVESKEWSPSQMVKEFNKTKTSKESEKPKAKAKPAATLQQILARFNKLPEKQRTPEVIKATEDELIDYGYELRRSKDGESVYPAKTTTTVPPSKTRKPTQTTQAGKKSSSTGSIPQFEVGETRKKGGKTYKYKGNDEWEEQ